MKNKILTIVSILTFTNHAMAENSQTKESKPISGVIRSGIDSTNNEISSLFPMERTQAGDSVQYALIGAEAYAYRRIVTGRGVLTRIPGYRALWNMLYELTTPDYNSGITSSIIKRVATSPLRLVYHLVHKADSVLKYYIVAETVGRLYVWRVLDKDPEVLPGWELGIVSLNGAYNLGEAGIKAAVDFVDSKESEEANKEAQETELESKEVKK